MTTRNGFKDLHGLLKRPLGYNILGLCSDFYEIELHTCRLEEELSADHVFLPLFSL